MPLWNPGQPLSAVGQLARVVVDLGRVGLVLVDLIPSAKMRTGGKPVAIPSSV